MRMLVFAVSTMVYLSGLSSWKVSQVAIASG
jgi:hypothetical protein